MTSKELKLVNLTEEIIINKILIIRGKKVMLDRDLAKLYEVPTKVLNQAVKRQNRRFPDDFMFQLNKEELKIWKSQIITSNQVSKNKLLRSQIVTLEGKGKHAKYLPFVFTEQGVAMLSSVLNSDRAIDVNIQIMRTFTKLRELLVTNKQLRQKIEAMEQKYDKNFSVIFQVIKELLQEEAKPKKPIGFDLK